MKYLYEFIIKCTMKIIKLLRKWNHHQGIDHSLYNELSLLKVLVLLITVNFVLTCFLVDTTKPQCNHLCLLGQVLSPFFDILFQGLNQLFSLKIFQLFLAFQHLQIHSNTSLNTLRNSSMI